MSRRPDSIVLASPLARVRSLPSEQRAKLAYSPDDLPGARDVYSPYGTMRAYEWGPDDGRKVLFLHGLSTPAPALRGVAQGLTEKGCRVMVLDLWGRGYSDTPSDLPHDIRLFTTQILLALSTSPLSWTGDKSSGFAVVGYSMGGGIAVAFVEYFPQLVSSLVLISPGGLYDQLPPELQALPVKFGWLFPLSYKKRFVRRLLNGAEQPRRPERKEPGDQRTSLQGLTDANQVAEQAGGQYVPIDVYGIVDSEIEHHEGFVYSIFSSLRHAPSKGYHQAWRRVGSYLSGDPEFKLVSGLPNRLWKTKALVLVAEVDSVLPTPHFVRAAKSTLGSDNVKIVIFDGDHMFPITNPREVAETIYDFWTNTR